MNKPRILLLYDFLTEVGGIEMLISTHARMLLHAGYPVKLLFGDIDPNLKNNEIYNGLEIEEYDSNKLNGSIKLIGGIIGMNKLKEIIQPNDILISYSFPVNVTLRKFNNIKILYLNHYPNFLWLPIKERWVWANNSQRKIVFFYSIFLGAITKYLDKKYVKNNSLIFINSNFTKNKLDPLYNINGVVSYPPVNNIFKYTPNNDTLKKYNINTSYLFASGRLIKDKHVNLLLEAYAKSKQAIPLVISGKGSETNNLITLSDKLGIKDKVKFIGFVTTEELIHLYSSAEAYIFPTPQEDFGLCPAESLSCGTPVITWGDGSGAAEQVNDGVNGYLAKPYDIEDMAKKIDICLNDDFKTSHNQDILESSKRFSEYTQKDIFLDAITKFIKQKDLNTTSNI
jgi:glycosyltransferase involved in cell wall biosynthesis